MVQKRRLGLVVFTLILWVVIYFAPTMMEALALRVPGGIWASLAVGDLAGCVALSFMRGPRVGLGLYLVLGIAKFFLIFLHLTPPGLLIWLPDLVPAFVVTSFFCQSDDRECPAIMT